MAQALFQEVKNAIDVADYEQIIQLTDKILAESSSDKEAILCKFVALLQLSKLSEAQALSQSHSFIKETLPFESCYLLYRLKNYDEALSSLPKEARSVELKAQILYGKGEYAEAAELFKEILAKNDSRLELYVNYGAALACTGRLNEVIKLSADSKVAKNSHEFLYNVGTAILLNGGKNNEALNFLRMAVEVGQSSLKSEDLTEQEIKDELAVIFVQMAFALEKVGHVEQASKTLEDILAIKPTDQNVVAVANINQISLHPDEKLFHAEKKIHAASTPDMLNKLLPFQKEVIARNKVIVQLKMNKPGPSREYLNQYKQEYPHAAAGYILEASLLRREKKNKEAQELLLKSIGAATNSKDEFELRLALCQLYLIDKDIEAALATLEGIAEPDNLHPGVVAAKFQLLIKLNREKDAVSLLSQAAVAWKTIGANSFSQHSISTIVLALAEVDPVLAAEYCKRLPPLETGTFTPDELDKLEALPAVKTKEPAPETKVTKDGKVEGEQIVQKKKNKKKKKKKRLPKSFDPNIPPDPERWLPLYMRSGNRTGRKRRANMQRAHQGGMDPDKEKEKAKVTTEAAKPVAAATSNPTTAKPNNARPNPKKKK